MSSKLILWADVICVGYYYFIFSRKGVGWVVFGVCVCVVGVFLFETNQAYGTVLTPPFVFVKV